MIGDLSRWLEARLKAQTYTGQRDAQRDERELQLVSAALLVEAARADHSFSDEERARLTSLLRKTYTLSEEDARDLVARGQDRSSNAVSLTDLTQTVNRHSDHATRKQLLVQMWKVALADGRIDKYEEYVIRQVAGLLYVPHEDYIHARLLAGQEN